MDAYEAELAAFREELKRQIKEHEAAKRREEGTKEEPVYPNGPGGAGRI